jgi:hypothetical protein
LMLTVAPSSLKPKFREETSLRLLHIGPVSMMNMFDRTVPMIPLNPYAEAAATGAK